ncbi:MAG: hypothetical protein K9M49_02595 [Candidatus Marinimicrobia bacterium]|nr:hypothetical protein [Candidatus Neomarinimicrobiota bacterium]MCF7904022.1 hypothetical protein [Candidatus Neomarinimicrobiota bacterium]
MAIIAIVVAIYSLDATKWLLVFSSGTSAIFFFVHGPYWTPEKSARIFGDLASKKDSPADSEIPG